jgi:hypothetical protein
MTGDDCPLMRTGNDATPRLERDQGTITVSGVVLNAQ